MQPLDLSLFGPLKQGWTKACAAFHHLTLMVVSQRNFAKIFNVAWHTSNTPEVIRGGFRRSGIYPFNPEKFDYGKLAPNNPTSCSAAPVSTTTIAVTQSGASTLLSQGASSANSSIPSVAAPYATSAPTYPYDLASTCNTPFTNEHYLWMMGDEEPAVSSTTNPSVQSASTSNCAVDLLEMEKKMDRQQRKRFRRRYKNGFDLTTDSTYNKWRGLRDHLDPVAMECNGTCPCGGECSCCCRGVGCCECVEAVLPPSPTTATLSPGQVWGRRRNSSFSQPSHSHITQKIDDLYTNW